MLFMIWSSFYISSYAFHFHANFSFFKSFSLEIILWDGKKFQEICPICKMLISSGFLQGMLLHSNQGFRGSSCWVNRFLLWWRKVKIIVILRVSNVTTLHLVLRQKLSMSAGFMTTAEFLSLPNVRKDFTRHFKSISFNQ